MSGKFWFFLCLFFLIFSLTPTAYELSRQNDLHPERAFELVHNFPTDYNFYLSRIREGIEGRTAVIEKYTSEPHAGSFIHEFYLILGWIGRWVRVPWERAGDVYHVARIVFGMTLLLLIAEFAKKSFTNNLLKSGHSEVANENLDPSSEAARMAFSTPSGHRVEAGLNFVVSPNGLFRLLGRPFFWQLLAFLLAVTASTWPKPVTVGDGTGRLGGYMPWWSVMDSLQRITFIPHLLAGQALILFLIMASSEKTVMEKPANWIFLGILAFILGMILPPGLIMVYAAAGFLLVIEAIRVIGEIRGSFRKKLEKLREAVTGPVIVCLLGLPALIYLQLMTSFYPWLRLTQFDILHPLPFDYIEYIKALGPVLPLGLFGLIVALYTRSKSLKSSVAWVLGWLSLLFVFHFVPQQSPLRFSEMIPHVPLGILSAYFFYFFYHRITNQDEYTNLLVSRAIMVIPLIIVATGLAVMWSSLFWQKDFVDHKVRATLPLVPTGSYVMYPLKDWLIGMKFLQDATSRDTVILSETTAGNYLPVYSGNTVYVGHANTVRAEEKETHVQAFFSGKLSQTDALNWLNKENLHYIFSGPQEKDDGGVSDLTKIYPFLAKIYTNPYVSIYQAP